VAGGTAGRSDGVAPSTGGCVGCSVFWAGPGVAYVVALWGVIGCWNVLGGAPAAGMAGWAAGGITVAGTSGPAAPQPWGVVCRGAANGLADGTVAAGAGATAAG
jgi:hypothetical protein